MNARNFGDIRQKRSGIRHRKMRILENKADILPHVVHVRHLRPEMSSQNALQNCHTDSVAQHRSEMPKGVQRSIYNSHVVCKGFGENRGDGVGSWAASYTGRASVETHCVYVHEWDLHLIDQAQSTLRVGSIQNDQVVASSRPYKGSRLVVT